MRKTGFIIATLFGLSLLATGCGSSDQAADQSADQSACTADNARSVTQSFITDSKFDVDCVKVAAGTPFYFVNNDATAHTVTSTNEADAFDAELPQKDSTYTHTFTTPGTYEITCKRHNEAMTLVVT